MWQVKKFKTREGFNKFIAANGHKIQWYEIVINQPTKRHARYAIEYRKLRRVY